MRQQRWLKLIKDYELEVHYHSGKANIVADALSRKAHCNYLSAVRLTREETSTHVPPNLSLFNMILTPTFRDEIIAAQKNDEGMGHIKRKMQEGDPKVIFSTRMWKGPYGLWKDWLCQRERLARRRFRMKLIRRGTPFIL
jgi:hypothetical protein